MRQWARNARAVIETLENNVADLCSWTQPRGGLFLWITLPETTDMEKLGELAGNTMQGSAKGAHFIIVAIQLSASVLHMPTAM